MLNNVKLAVIKWKQKMGCQDKKLDLFSHIIYNSFKIYTYSLLYRCNFLNLVLHIYWKRNKKCFTRILTYSLVTPSSRQILESTNKYTILVYWWWIYNSFNEAEKRREKRCLFFCFCSFGHCVVCPFSIYWFRLPHWYLQTLLIMWSTMFKKK